MHTNNFTGDDFDRINNILSEADNLSCLLLAHYIYITTGRKTEFETACKEYGVTPQEFMFWYHF